MTTVLLADRDGSAFGPLGERTVPALLPSRAVPVFERMLEALAAANIRSALVITGPRAAEVERRFGRGIRWGIALAYVRREGDETAGDVLRRLEHRLDGETLVLRADVGNHEAVGEFVRRASEVKGPIVAAVHGGLPAGFWKIGAGALKKAVIPREPGSPEWKVGKDQTPLELETEFRLLDSIAACREADRSGSTTVSPRAVVFPGAVLGAGTSVSEEAVVCAGAKLEDVGVLPRTVVPSGVSLRAAIVAGNLVADAASGSATLLTDLLPPAPARVARSSPGLDRAVGTALLLGSAPLWLVAFVWAFIANAGHTRRPVQWNLNGVGTDSVGRPRRLPVDTFQFETAVPVLKDLPLLLSVAAGKLALRGVAPLSVSDEEALEPGWRQIRREGLVGLLAPSRILGPPSAPAEVPLVLDAFEARRPTPGLFRLGLSALFGKAGWVAPRAFNPDEIDGIQPS